MKRGKARASTELSAILLSSEEDSDLQIPEEIWQTVNARRVANHGQATTRRDVTDRRNHGIIRGTTQHAAQAGKRRAHTVIEDGCFAQEPAATIDLGCARKPVDRAEAQKAAVETLEGWNGSDKSDKTPSARDDASRAAMAVPGRHIIRSSTLRSPEPPNNGSGSTEPRSVIHETPDLTIRTWQTSFGAPWSTNISSLP